MKIKVFRIEAEDGEVRLFLDKSTIKLAAPYATLTIEHIEGLEAKLLYISNIVAYNGDKYLYEGFKTSNGVYELEYSDEPLKDVNLQKVYNIYKPEGKKKLVEGYKSFAWPDWENLFNQAIQLGYAEVLLQTE